jgi:hypothetical protein
MAEDEILKKHVKTAYKAWHDPEKDWKHKVKDILLEILIIVFAVTVSIWLHNWSEDRKDRKTEKEFLVGLKGDIKADMTEMQSDRAFLKQGLTGLFYFEKVGSGFPLNQDSLGKYYQLFFSQTQINPRISRFEALKGSGKLDIIENKKLLYNITDLYQKLFPQIFRSNAYNNAIISDKLASYLADNIELSPKGEPLNAEKVFRSSKMRIFMGQAGGLKGSIDAYTAGIDKGNEIIKQIDEELK